jgi:hypothetical protein
LLFINQDSRYIIIMKWALSLLLTFTLFITSPAVNAEVYYINDACDNEGDGSARTCALGAGQIGAFRSTSSIDWNSLQPGDTVYVAGANNQSGANGRDFNGEYIVDSDNERIKFTSGGGSLGNPVTVAEDQLILTPG